MWVHHYYYPPNGANHHALSLQVELKGKRVLVRCDLNVPLDGNTITDDTRIRASIPTIKYLLENGARVALSSHLGRPKNGPEEKFSLAPVALRLRCEYIMSRA